MYRPCGCPDDVTKVRELCSDNCKHYHPWGTGLSPYEKEQRRKR